MDQSNRCLICLEQPELPDILICGKKECEYMARTVNLGDNYVVKYIRQQPCIAKFLLKLGDVSLAKHKPEDYDPSPIFIGHDKKESYSLLTDAKINWAKFWPVISDDRIDTDAKIEDVVGLVVYGWIRFTLKSSLLSLSKDSTLSTHDGKITVLKVDHFLEGFASEFAATESEKSSTSTSTSTSASTSTTGGNERMFFHGSNYLNWYSIINNGLKNYSGTQKQVNGAAFGKGIYLSSTSQLSMVYSSGQEIILGVFSILGDAKKWHKGGSIYVVPNESKVKLRYLITASRQNIINSVSYLDKLFATQVASEKKHQTHVLSNIKNRRLIKEIRYFSQNPEKHREHGLSCQFDDGNMLVWKLFLSKFDSKSPLANDLAKIGLDQIELEVRLSDRFPMTPPFIRIIRPRFQYRTGHITLGGSICMELLTNQGWNPTYSLENLFIHIKSIILEGEGRIDMKSWNLKYDYQEAISAFQRTLLSHGWK